VRQQLDHDRCLQIVRGPTGDSTNRPARDHIGLPVGLVLDPSDANVERKQEQA
jgi:hypothetical protein